MKFTDFPPEQLIGKTVLYTSGKSYNTRMDKSILKIDKVLKTGFRISGDHNKEKLFDFKGWQKGLGGRQDMGTISKCQLLTDDEAADLRNQWKQNKEARGMREYIAAALPKLSHTQLAIIYGELKNVEIK